MNNRKNKIKCRCGEGYYQTITEEKAGKFYKVEICSACGHKVFATQQIKKYQKIL